MITLRPGLGITRLRFNGYNLSLTVRHPFEISEAKVLFFREKRNILLNFAASLKICLLQMKVMSFRPKLFDTLKGYSRADFLRDLMAGVIVGIVALPLAIAFGIASGVSPEKGIITAVIAGFVVSLLGGSR